MVDTSGNAAFSPFEQKLPEDLCGYMKKDVKSGAAAMRGSSLRM